MGAVILENDEPAQLVIWLFVSGCMIGTADTSYRLKRRYEAQEEMRSCFIEANQRE